MRVASAVHQLFRVDIPIELLLAESTTVSGVAATVLDLRYAD